MGNHRAKLPCGCEIGIATGPPEAAVWITRCDACAGAKARIAELEAVNADHLGHIECANNNVRRANARTGKAERERDAALWACRGGNAVRDTADLLTFMADRLVSEHQEDESTDWVRAAYERARMLRSALEAKGGAKSRIAELEAVNAEHIRMADIVRGLLPGDQSGTHLADITILVEAKIKKAERELAEAKANVRRNCAELTEMRDSRWKVKQELVAATARIAELEGQWEEAGETVACTLINLGSSISFTGAAVTADTQGYSNPFEQLDALGLAMRERAEQAERERDALQGQIDDAVTLLPMAEQEEWILAERLIAHLEARIVELGLEALQGTLDQAIRDYVIWKRAYQAKHPFTDTIAFKSLIDASNVETT